jgi:hypothetical protein
MATRRAFVAERVDRAAAALPRLENRRMRPSVRLIALVAAAAWPLAAPVAAKPPAKTHLGVAPSDHVTLLPEGSPTQPGIVAPVNFALDTAGGPPVAFTLPPGTALAVTDVSVSIPAANAPPGRYAASLCDTPCFFARIPVHIDTATDGFQKNIALTGVVVFRTLPQFDVLAGVGSGMSVLVHGYLVKDR